MMDLITEHIATWTGAQIPKANGGRGRGRGAKGQSPHGIKKLRELILELAVRGKLVQQDPNDEPASVLLEKIAKEKARLIKEGEIKKQKPLPKIGDGEKHFSLPDGWAWTRLGDIIFCQAGFAFKSRFFNEIGEGLPLIRIRDVGQPFTGTFYFGEYREEFLVNTGDYLISMDGQFRVAPWANDVALLNQRVARLIFFDEGIGKRFVAESLQACLLELQGIKAYTTVDHLSGTQISESVIAFPPLMEQHRIVAKVDELMALCDKLEQQQTDSNDTHKTLVETLLATLTTVADPAEFVLSWQRIVGHFDTLFTTEESIEQLKQTILQLAVMGKLVPQDPNDEPASTLLEKIAKEKARLIKEGKIKKQKPHPKISENEKPFELPEGWEWVRFGVAFDVTSSKRIHVSDYVTEGVPFFRSKEIGELNKGLPISTDIFIPYEKYEEIRRLPGFPNINDLMLTSVGSIGNTWICDGRDFYYKDGNITKVGSHDFADMYYAQYFIDAPLFSVQVTNTVSGTAYNALTIMKLNNLLFPLPPLAEQHRIVAKVDELIALCDNLKKRMHDAQTTQVQLADAIVEQALVV